MVLCITYLPTRLCGPMWRLTGNDNWCKRRGLKCWLEWSEGMISLNSETGSLASNQSQGQNQHTESGLESPTEFQDTWRTDSTPIPSYEPDMRLRNSRKVVFNSSHTNLKYGSPWENPICGAKLMEALCSKGRKCLLAPFESTIKQELSKLCSQLTTLFYGNEIF